MVLQHSWPHGRHRGPLICKSWWHMENARSVFVRKVLNKETKAVPEPSETEAPVCPTPGFRLRSHCQGSPYTKNWDPCFLKTAVFITSTDADQDEHSPSHWGLRKQKQTLFYTRTVEDFNVNGRWSQTTSEPNLYTDTTIESCLDSTWEQPQSNT